MAALGLLALSGRHPDIFKAPTSVLCPLCEMSHRVSETKKKKKVFKDCGGGFGAESELERLLERTNDA